MNRIVVFILGIACILASSLFLTSCRQQPPAPPPGPPAPATQPLSAVVGTWKTQQTIAPFFYQQVLPAGSTIDVKPFTNPGDQKTALLAGSLDMTGTTMVQAIISSSKGEPVVYVASLCNKCSALIVQPRGAIKTPADLRGKKIGYVPNTMHHVLLLETLAQAGLKPTDVTLVRVDFFDMKAALAGKKIDAFLSGEPFPSAAIQDGTGVLLTYPYYGESVGTINAGMLVTKDMVQKHPEKVQALVTAHAKATEYLKAHSDEWIAKAAEFGTKAEVLREASKNIELSWDIDDAYIAHARALAKRMQDLGMIDKQPDWTTLFDTRFVTEARKEVAAK